ncbi:MAG: sulfotransferase [Spirulinaceae cyanobacterium]
MKPANNKQSSTNLESNELVAPQTTIQTHLVDLWQEILEVKVGVHDNFFELGGNSIKAALFFNRLQEKFGGVFYIVALFEAPTIAEFENYLHQYYPELVARVLGKTVKQNPPTSCSRLKTNHIEQIRQLIRPLPTPSQQPSISTKNQSACFILSAPRSGSTLLRVILAGHPQLFAPPQLCLLQFNTLAERKAILTGEYSFWREGTIQALKQVEGYNSEEAQALMRHLEKQRLNTKEFYHWLQQRLEGKLLVDKTTTYPLNLATLQKAETEFDKPVYIHLVRHPYGVIRSFEEAKLDITLTPFIPKLKDRNTFPFTRQELAELLWLTSNQNILTFLPSVPQHRQYTLQFENLVTQPETTVKHLCQFLNLDFDPQMLQPYATPQQKMTEGLNSKSGMLGDLKFHQHKSINPNVANNWQNYYNFDFLSEPTWELAQVLGYTKTLEKLSEREDGEL